MRSLIVGELALVYKAPFCSLGISMNAAQCRAFSIVVVGGVMESSVHVRAVAIGFIKGVEVANCWREKLAAKRTALGYFVLTIGRRTQRVC